MLIYDLLKGPSISSSSSRTVGATAEGSVPHIEASSQGHSGCPTFSQQNLLRTNIASHDSSFSHHRPATAPGFHDTEALDLLLPPRRELPFLQDTTKIPQTNNNHKTPSFKLPANFKAANETSSLEISHAPPVSEVTTCLDNSTGITDAAPSQPSNMGFKSNQRATCNMTPHCTPPSAHQNTEPESHQATSPPNPSISNPQANMSLSSIESLHSLIASVINAHQTKPQSSSNAFANPSLPLDGNATASADLASYLAAPDSERSVLVESWICQQLENDGFLKLCEDLEGVWKRIAIGR
jgi:hypothetical protein